MLGWRVHSIVRHIQIFDHPMIYTGKYHFQTHLTFHIYMFQYTSRSYKSYCMSHLQILSHLYIIRSQAFPGYPIINSIWLYIPYIYIMINPISVYDILSSVYQYIHIISIYHGIFISMWYTVYPMTSHLPSGKRLHNYGKSPCYSWGNSRTKWWFAIVM